MDTEWHSIVDVRGRKGTCQVSADDVEIKLESGERLIMPRNNVIAQPDGCFRIDHAFADLLGAVEKGQLVVPVLEERLSVSTRVVDREHVRVTTSVSSRDELVDVALSYEELQVERVPVNRVVEQVSAPWVKGETMVVPVYEETLFVEKRLVLREELHVTRIRHEKHAPERVTLRREEVTVERTDGDGTSPSPTKHSDGDPRWQRQS